MKLFVAILLAGFTSLAQALPEIKTWQTDSDMKVLFVQSSELPIVDIQLTFDAGSSRDGNLHGLSVIAHTLLDKGAAEMDADAIASRFEDVGAQFSANVSLDRSSISLRTLSDSELFNDALNTYITVISTPTFPERDFNREKNRLLVALEDQKQRPGQIVDKTFFKSIYQDHPYANPSEGNQESVNKITLAEVKEFYKNHFVTGNGVLAIVGDLEENQAKDIAEKISRSLKKGKKLPLIESTVNSSSKQETIDFPSQQAHVRIGQLGIERGNPDYFNLYVGNHVLGGGGFTSRLMEEVRSKRGLSYSVYSYFFPLRQTGPFVLGLQTRVDQAQQAIDVCFEVLNEYIDVGPTQEELDLSKKSIISGFPLRVDSNRDILGYLSVIGYYNLPLDYLNEFTQKIEQVSLEDVKRAFRKHLKPESFVTVVVGSEQAS